MLDEIGDREPVGGMTEMAVQSETKSNDRDCEPPNPAHFKREHMDENQAHRKALCRWCFSVASQSGMIQPDLAPIEAVSRQRAPWPQWSSRKRQSRTIRRANERPQRTS